MLAKIDTERVRTEYPLLDLVSGEVELFDSSGGAARGLEYRGPCPFCRDGEDRFAVWPAGGGDNLGRFNCRVCDRNGDVIAYVQQRRGLDFVSAVRWLEGRVSTIVENAQTSPEKPLQRPKGPELEGETLFQWQNTLEVMSQKALYCLMEDDTAEPARRWLAGRGIGLDQIAHYGLGYNDKWRTIIPSYKLPPGVLLPRWDNDILITAVNVYLAKEARATFKSKRAWVKGSQPKAAMFNGWRLETAETVVIFEGELDAALFSRFFFPRAYPTIVPVATGGASMIPDDITSLAGKRVVVIFDDDQAGVDFANSWADLLPGCQATNVPTGKDLTECYKAGWDVTRWLHGVL